MSARVRHGNDGPLPPEIQTMLEEKDAQIEQLNAEKEELESQKKEAQDQWLRLKAEFENYRKRLDKKHKEQQLFASQSLIVELLESIDDFEHAFHPDNLNGDKETILRGFFQICLKILSTLQNHGVNRIETEKIPFDPNLHEAIQVEDSQLPANSIVRTLRNGYMLHDRIIRVAQVAVSNGSQAPPPEGEFH